MGRLVNSRVGRRSRRGPDHRPVPVQVTWNTNIGSNLKRSCSSVPEGVSVGKVLHTTRRFSQVGSISREPTSNAICLVVESNRTGNLHKSLAVGERRTGFIGGKRQSIAEWYHLDPAG